MGSLSRIEISLFIYHAPLPGGWGSSRHLLAISTSASPRIGLAFWLFSRHWPAFLQPTINLPILPTESSVSSNCCRSPAEDTPPTTQDARIEALQRRLLPLALHPIDTSCRHIHSLVRPGNRLHSMAHVQEPCMVLHRLCYRWPPFVSPSPKVLARCICF